MILIYLRVFISAITISRFYFLCRIFIVVARPLILSQSPGNHTNEGDGQGSFSKKKKEHSDLGSQPLMTIPPFTKRLLYFSNSFAFIRGFTQKNFILQLITAFLSLQGILPMASVLRCTSNTSQIESILTKINVNVFLTQHQQNFFD